jgi:uncharacterized protein YdhG (YjbR/CyaY superfamily)
MPARAKSAAAESAPAKTPRARPAGTDAYLAALPADQRAALQALRRTIRAAAPRAEEGSSYALPAFLQDGALVAFGASAKHCAFYPLSPAVISAHARELRGFQTSKGTIRFTPDKPLPAALVRKLVKARLAEKSARGRAASGRARSR